MATRRLPRPSSPVAPHALSPSQSSTPTAPSNTSPAVPGRIIAKLLLFTALMISAPLGVYFSSLNMVFSGNSTWAGVSAAVTANLVLAAYIVAAVWEDQGDDASGSEVKKAL